MGGKNEAKKNNKNNWMICEQNPWSQIPVFPPCSSPQLRRSQVEAAKAEIMSRYVLPSDRRRGTKWQSLRRENDKKPETKKACHESPLRCQAEWSENTEARLSRQKKRQKLEYNHLRCFSDDGWMMKEQPGSERGANTEWMPSL